MYHVVIRASVATVTWYKLNIKLELQFSTVPQEMHHGLQLTYILHLCAEIGLLKSHSKFFVLCTFYLFFSFPWCNSNNIVRK